MQSDDISDLLNHASPVQAFARVGEWTADEIVTHWARLFWSPLTHWYQPGRLRDAVHTTLCVATRPVCGAYFPREVWRAILHHLIGSDWSPPAVTVQVPT